MYRHTDRNCFLPAEQSKNIHIRVLGSETRTMFRTASCVNCSGATSHVLEASRRVPTYLRLVAGIKLFVGLPRGQGIRSIFHRGTGHQIEACCNWALEYHTLILFSVRNPYEIKVYTFFSPWLLKSPGKPGLMGVQVSHSSTAPCENSRRLAIASTSAACALDGFSSLT